MKALFLLLIISTTYAADPSWMSTLRSGDYQNVVETRQTVLFRHIADCRNVIAEAELMIKNAYPEKLQVPYNVEVLHKSERGDCGVTLSVDKRKIAASENVPAAYTETMSQSTRIDKLIKLLRKGMNIEDIRRILADPGIKKDAWGFINVARPEKMCYDKFKSNAGILVDGRYLICMSDFDWDSRIMGILGGL